MKIITTYILFLGFLLSTSLVTADISSFELIIRQDQNELILSYSFDQPQLSTIEFYEVEYDMVTISGLQNGGEAGAPYLPIQPALIYIPQNRQISTITITADEKINLGTNLNIQPCQDARKIGDYIFHPTQCNQTIYESTKEFPGTLYKEIGIFFSKGHEILVLNIHPIQYIPSTGQLYFYNNINIRIQLSQTINENKFISFKQNDLDYVNRLVDNSETFQSFNTENQLLSVSGIESVGICDGEDEYEYVIITTNTFRDYNGENSFSSIFSNFLEPILIFLMAVLLGIALSLGNVTIFFIGMLPLLGFAKWLIPDAFKAEIVSVLVFFSLIGLWVSRKKSDNEAV